MRPIGHSYEDLAAEGLLWTPGMLAGGLKCRLDASDFSAMTLSGWEATAIRDQPPAIGGAWSRVSAGPDFGLTSFAGRPGLSFTASPHERIVSDTYVAVTLPLVAVALFLPDSGTKQYSRFLAWASSSGSDSGSTNGLSCMIRDFHTGAGGSFNLSTYFNGAVRCSTAMTYGQINLCSVTIDASGNIAHWINGAAGSTGTLGATPTWSAVRFMVGCQDVAGGSGSDNAPFLGSHRGGLVYCGAELTLARQLIEGWLGWDARLPNLLGGAHPYRSGPPLIGG